MRTSVLRLGAAIALVGGLAIPAAAQTSTGTTNTPSFELGAGYQFAHLPDQSFPIGFAIDAARHFGSLGLVGELGWSRDSEEIVGGDVNFDLITFGAGPRWTGFGTGRGWPYVQVIAGAQVQRVGVDIENLDSDSESRTAFMLQPGVGATFVAGDGWGVFGQVDYRRTFFDDDEVDVDGDDDANNQFRVFVGVRMILD